MKVCYFSELTENQVKFIADTNYNYWKHFNPKLDYNESTQKINSMRSNIDKLPLGIALIDNETIIGFCTLRENRLDNHLDINPWLCNVMVFSEFRKKGYARKMIEFACEKFKQLGFDKIYSWTDQVPDFYKSLGWNYEGKVTKNEGGEGLLFSKEI